MTSFLSNIYWIGGSPCAGKSTIASAIVQSCNIPVYRCDDAYLAHQRLISPDH